MKTSGPQTREQTRTGKAAARAAALRIKRGNIVKKHVLLAASLSALAFSLACGGGGQLPSTTQQPVASPSDTNPSAQPPESEQGFPISGAVSAVITWEQDFLPSCYATTADDGA